jgi:hypothetical protein
MASGTAEVKLDRQAMHTGNVFVEFECQTALGWRPSGITTTKAHTWVFVLSHLVIVALPVWLLKNIARQIYVDGGERLNRSGSHPTKGVVIPLERLLPEAVSRLDAPVTEVTA